ncbi:MAG: phosphotransferase [Anaerolineae bacterium]|nr:phosphotransferase [Anaerolineae bacterium]
MDVSDNVRQQGGALFDFEAAALRSIPGSGAPDGVVFDYDDGGAATIVKFMPVKPDDLDAVRDKIAFVDYLRTHGVRTAQYVPSQYGNLLETVEENGETYAVLKMLKAPGRHPHPRAWDESFYRAWGRTVAQIHVLSQQYDGGAHIPGWEDEHASFVNMCQDHAILEEWQALGEILRELPQPRGAFGLIHNDPHAWNFLVDGDDLTVLDFDVCTRSWFALDIAIALFHPLWDRRRKPDTGAFSRRFIRGWLDGYREIYQLDTSWLERLPLFVRYRQMLFYIVSRQEQAALPEPWRKRLLTDLRHAILHNQTMLDMALVLG